ncbi:UNVERIFIED_CONTAM: eIF-2-alpha kinase GCN2 [Sesamum calycinum]|uniref:EIF-2-alpha kinase GCN2 n=1 Tax=Sesamum calycinum TaxID=2727403 RepID=A0AAW2RSC9_9LAMI
MLRTIHSSEDTSIYEKIVSAIFDEDTLSTKDNHENVGRLKSNRDDASSIIFTDLDTANRDLVVDIAVEVCRQHCAKHLEIIPMRMLGDCPQVNRNTVKLLTHGGDMVEFCHELRFPFVKWIIAKQKSFFRRYEISYVYRKAVGHSPPNRYLQGDFDIVGGTTSLTEAEVIKVTMDILTRFFHSESCDIHLNHGDVLEAIWSWTGIKSEYRQKVAELLLLLGSLPPQSSERKSKWVVIRRQLRQELGLADDALNRLQTVGLRFCGTADQALPRLRGALPADKSTRKALDELAELFNYLRVWKIDRHVFLDALMPPTEFYHRNLYFQVANSYSPYLTDHGRLTSNMSGCSATSSSETFKSLEELGSDLYHFLREIYLRKDNNPVSLMEGTLLALGGRYDYLLQQMADAERLGLVLLWRLFCYILSVDSKSYRGGGGLLVERMELVAELWEENIKVSNLICFKIVMISLAHSRLTGSNKYRQSLCPCVIQASLNNMNMRASMISNVFIVTVITDSGVSQKSSVKVGLLI